MNPISLVITVSLCLSILVVPRKYLLLPFIAAACIIPMDQRIIVVEMDFTSLRFCVLAGFIRLFLRGEMRPIQFNHIDKLFFAWLIAGAIIYVLQWQSFDAVINRSGVLFDGVGLYWIFRQSFRNWNDVVNAIQFFAFFAILSAPLFLVERIQQHSPYSILGHSPAAFHRGRFRCSGPFPPFYYDGLVLGLYSAVVLCMHQGRIFKIVLLDCHCGCAIVRCSQRIQYALDDCLLCSAALVALQVSPLWKTDHGRYSYNADLSSFSNE